MAEQPQQSHTSHDDDPDGGGIVLRTIPLSRIVVADDHNPRRSFEQSELDRLAHAMTTRGFSHPILVKPVAEPEGHFELIDGERRFRAAQQAAIVEIPAVVKTGDDTTPGGDLLDAMLANDLGVKLDVVEEARGFRRLITEAGLTRKGVAQAFKIPVERVRERLAILELPEALHEQVASGTIPLRPVKPLGALAKIHVDLPAVAVTRVLDRPPHSWDAPTTWEDLAHDPIGVVTGRYDDEAADLPRDVFVAGHSYPVDRFELDEGSIAKLTKLCALLPGVEPETFQVRLERTAVERAAALQAAHPSKDRHTTLIIGSDVAAQLAGDYVAACLKVQRDNARRDRASARETRPAEDGTHGSGAAPTPQTPEERDRRAREEREAQRQRRAAARTANELLGSALVKHLSTVKVDERVLKILTASPLSDDLARVAARGARLGFPAWVTVEQRANGTVKATYLQTADAETKAREYLAGAKSAAEVAGRSLALVAMARWADEDAVPASQASNYRLEFAGYSAERHGVPWRTEADDLLAEILLERLPHDAATPIREARAQRDRDRAEQERRERQQVHDREVAAFAEHDPATDPGSATPVEPEALAA
jgi:ParB/RepB/Spo0J family partition protein